MGTSREDLGDCQKFTSVNKCILHNGWIDVSSHDMNLYFSTFMASYIFHQNQILHAKKSHFHSNTLQQTNLRALKAEHPLFVPSKKYFYELAIQ